MWVVVKYKTSELKTLKDSFCKILGGMPEFYNPKIRYERYVNNKLRVFEENILVNYLMCKHDKFKDHKIINLLKNSRGLSYFLNGFEFNQKDLVKFVKLCKSHETINGFLSQNFFDVTKKKKAKFISGPFAQMIFDILEDRGKKLKVLINNLNITIHKNSSNLLYT